MVRYPPAALFAHLLVLAGATLTDPNQWPGINHLPICVQGVFQGCLYNCAYDGCIPCDIGCGDWTCACTHFSGAISAASSAAATACTSQTDIASATSIVNGFCGQLLASATGPTAPTLAPIASPTPSIEKLSGGGLSSSDKIALGVGIGIGLPGAIVAIWQICRWVKGRELHDDERPREMVPIR